MGKPTARVLTPTEAMVERLRAFIRPALRVHLATKLTGVGPGAPHDWRAMDEARAILKPGDV